MCIALGAGVGLLEGCGSPQAFECALTGGALTVPLSLFQTAEFQLVRSDALRYDVGVRKERSGEFTAVLLRCTHVENPVSPRGDGYECSLHGSHFDSSGQVLRGPAQRPLQQYPTEIDGESLRILVARIAR